ncbi:segregation/condensation protein A [Chryseomicrobium sp. FSL W7-1435]|uniref:segregation/condensation protein A n=1 Tax=Chryseomicrobium sp. FSL W7-1435 TaxID=2921704 RepID=UPI00315AF2B1
MAYEVKVEAFEGPLDLLLHLINRLEIDIYDIKMTEITSQYMEHVHAMQVLELNEASEYLVMAATLLSIKSKMLLPAVSIDFDEADEFDEFDPRDELVNRLLEYKRFKEAAGELKELEVAHSQHFSKLPTVVENHEVDKNVVLDQHYEVYDLLGAFQKMFKRKLLQAPLSTRISKAEISIKVQMESVLQKLQNRRGKLSFDELFDTNERAVIVATFLSVLELMKRQFIQIHQTENFTNLEIELMKEVHEHEMESEFDQPVGEPSVHRR